MKIPKKFTFLGTEWKVSYKMPKDEAWGETIFNDNEIHIRPDLSQQNKEMTFIHEVLHVITWSSGADRLVEQDVEEKLVNALANGLYGMHKKGIFQ